ncbi:hypothetical protein [Bacillus manliponensis]|nr:hypothetical protein [Bacillus manliponensis]
MGGEPLIKFVQFLFGKPCKKGDTFQTKFMRFIYWKSIILYFFALFLFGILSIFSEVFIPSFVGTLFFPVVFRLVYYMNLKINNLEKEV